MCAASCRSLATHLASRPLSTLCPWPRCCSMAGSRHHCRFLALVPARLGLLQHGASVRSASPLHAAYWAAWADALPVLRSRPRPPRAASPSSKPGPRPLLLVCVHAGWEGRPAWNAIYDGLRQALAMRLNYLSLARGARAGSIMALAFVQPPFAKPSCRRLSHQPRKRCCVRILGRALPLGFATSR